MRNPLSDPNYLSGLHDPNAPSSEDTEDRSWLTFGKDVAIDALARPVVSAVRTGTQYARMADEENPTLQAIDTGVGGAQKWLMDQRSTRAQALDTLSLAPGPDDRSFYREPLAGSIHSILPSVPYALAAIATGGTSLLAQGATAAAGGILGGSEAINELRDFADTTPIDQLKQLPVWDDLMAKAGGDERKARIQLFRDSLDPKSLTFNFLVNALEVPAFARGVRGGAGLSGRAKLGLDVKNRVKAAGEGAVVGGLSGGLEGGTEAYIEEYAKQQRGETTEIDPAAVESGIAKGAVFAGPVSAFHAIAPSYKADGPAGTGSGERAVLAGQLQPGQPRIFPDEGMPEQPPMPGQGQDVVTPEAPLAPQFPEMERPGAGGPGGFDPADFGGEESRVGPAPAYQPGVPYGQKPQPYGPPKPTRDQQLYQRTGVYDQEQQEQPQAQPSPFAADRVARLQRDLDNLEAGQLGRESILTSDDELLNWAANRGMEMDQAQRYLEEEHARAEEKIGQLRAYLGEGQTFARERQAGAPARRAAMRATGIPQRRVKPYSEAAPVSTGQMEGEGPPVIAPEEQLAPTFPEMEDPVHAMREDWGEREFERWTREQYQPGIDAHDEDLIRGGVATFTRDQREAFAQEMIGHANRAGKLLRTHIPQKLLDAMEPVERGALGRVIERDPQRALDIVRRPPEGTKEHPVLHELKQRLKTRKAERAREAKEAAEAKEAEVKTWRIAEKPTTEPYKRRKETVGERVRRQVATSLRRHREKEAKEAAAALRKKERVIERERVARSEKQAAEKAEVARKERAAAEKAEAEKPEQTDADRYNRINKALGSNPDPDIPEHYALLVELRWMNQRRVRNGELPLNLPYWENPPAKKPKEYTDAQALSDSLRLKEANVNVRRKPIIGGAERARSATISQRLRERKGLPPLKRVVAEEFEEGARWTAHYRKHVYDLGKAAVRRMRRIGKEFVTRTAPLSEQEVIDLWTAEQGRRIAEMQRRVEEGLPPLREATTVDGKVRKSIRTVQGYMPTLDDALDAFHEMREQEKGQKWTKSSRDPNYVAREKVYGNSLKKSVITRFGTEKRFRELLGKLDLLAKITRAMGGKLAVPGKKNSERAAMITPQSRLPEGTSPSVQKWFRETLEKLTPWSKTRELPLLTQAELRAGLTPDAKAQRDIYMNAKREELRLAKELKTFLHFAIDKAKKDMIIYKNAQNIKGRSINWELSKRQVRDSIDKDGRVVGSRVTYQSGKENEGNWNYNWLNDVQKVNESLGNIIANLEDIETGKTRAGRDALARQPAGAKARRKVGAPREQAVGMMASRREEFASYATALDKSVESFADRMSLFLDGKLAEAAEIRKQKNLEQTERRVMKTGVDLDTVVRAEEAVADRGEPQAETAYEGEPATGLTVEGEGRTIHATEKTVPAGESKVEIKERLEAEAKAEAEAAAEQKERRDRANVALDEDAAELSEEDLIEEGVDVARRAVIGGGKSAEDRGVNVIEEAYLQAEEQRIAKLERVAAHHPKVAVRERAQAVLDKIAAKQRQIADIPLKRAVTNVSPEMLAKLRARGLAVPAPGPVEMAAPAMSEAEQAVWDQAPVVQVGDLFTIPPTARGEVSVGAYAIAEDGQIHLVQNHTYHTMQLLTAMGRPDWAENVNVFGPNHFLEGNRSYVHVSTFVEPSEVSIGVDNSKNLTAAQQRTIKRIAAEAKKQERAGQRIEFVRSRQEMAMPMRGAAFGPPSQYDQHGLPKKRLPRWKSGQDEASLTNNQRRHIAAYDSLVTDSAPLSSLISLPQTATQVIARVKAMLAAGVTGHNMPSKYVTTEFLDQLAKNAGDVAIYHAPFDAVSLLGKRGMAFYVQEQNRIALPNDISPDNYIMAAIHEMTHALETRLMAADPRFAEEVRDLLAAARRFAEKHDVDLNKLPRELYGLTDPHEFLAETQSNENFRQYLNRIKAPDSSSVIGEAFRSLMNALYKSIRDAFRRVMGATHGDTALDTLYYDQSTVLGLADKMVKRTMDTIARHGRPPFIPVDEGTQFAGDGVNYLSAAGTKAFIGDIIGAGKEAGHELGDAAKYAWTTMDKNRGLGMMLHTLSDLTKRGSDALQQLANRLLDTVERQNHERTRIMRELDKPNLDRMETFFNGLNDTLRKATKAFLIDESYHGAFADAELFSARNSHLYKRQTAEEKANNAPRVFDDSLKNAQIKLEHPAMMAELERLEREAPGFKAIRDMVHAWTTEREKLMRSGRIRDFLKVSGLTLPTDKAELESVLDVLERAVDNEKLHVRGNQWDRVLNRTDERVLRRHLGDINDPKIKGVLDDIADTPDLDKNTIAGPYTPFTRRGDYALSGNFVLPMPEGALVLEGGINPETNEPIGNPRYVFQSEDVAREYIKETTEKYGIKLIKAGQIYIDTETGKPAMTDDPGFDAEDQERLKGKALQDAIDAGRPIEKQYYVQFQTKLLEFHPTERAAAAARADWEAHGREKGFTMKLSHPKDVLDQEGRVNERYVGQQLMNLIRTARASTAYQDLHKSQQGDITSALNMAGAQYTMRRGIKQRYLPRGYVTGASTNVMETYSEWSGMTAGYLAKVRYAADIKERSQAMRDYVKAHEYAAGNTNAMVDDRVYNEFMQRLHSPNINPRGTWLQRWVERGLRWTMLDKLPSIAYFTVQTTEPAIVAAPLLTDHHSPASIAYEMGGMYRLAGISDFMREGWTDFKKSFAKTGGADFRWDKLFGQQIAGEADATRLGELYDEANARNYFDAAASLDFENRYSSERNFIDKAADWLQGMFQAANTAIENLNRFVTLGTAYRLEYEKLNAAGDADAHRKAIDYALNKAHEANGIYSAYNAPPIFGSTTLGRVVFQFKKYPQRITANYIRAMVGTVGGFGDWAQGRKMTPEHRERARQLAYMLATQALVAGAMGLPTELFAVPLNTLYIAGLSPYNWDHVQAGFRQWSADTFGVTGGELASHGLFRLTGLDFASRLNQNTMWTFGSPASNKPKDLMASLATMFSGALGSTSFEFLQGMQKGAQAFDAYSSGATSLGNERAMEALKNLAMFRIVGDVLDASRKMTAQGMQTASGAQMREPYGPFEALAKAAGFTPAREAESSEARRAKQQATQGLKAERKSWLDMYAEAQPAERATMRPLIDRWNKSQPASDRLTQSDLLKAIGARQKREKAPASQLGLPADKRSRQFENIPKAYNF